MVTLVGIRLADKRHFTHRIAPLKNLCYKRSMHESVSLYIHIPFCHQKCDYCDFYSLPRLAKNQAEPRIPDSYIGSLLSEAAFYANRYDVKSWRTVYIGGGTPSLLTPTQLTHLMQGITKTAPLAEHAEVTMEMNPESVSAALIQAAAATGINRISLGVQALDDTALKAVHRAGSKAQALQALTLLSEQWVNAHGGRLSADLIAGLPKHTMPSFVRGIEELCSYPLDHISLYTLTIEDGTPLFRRIQNGSLPHSEEKADRMWLAGRHLLEKNGFQQYEVSNFAKPGCESKHNCVYWQLENYIGIGSGASGSWYGKPHADKSAGCEDGVRWTNPPLERGAVTATPAQKAAASAQKASPQQSLTLPEPIIEILDSDTQQFEYLMMGFRQLIGVSEKAFQSRFNTALSEAIGAQNGVFADWKKRRLARVIPVRNTDGTKDTRYALNRRGILLLNRFLEELL